MDANINKNEEKRICKDDVLLVIKRLLVGTCILLMVGFIAYALLFVIMFTM